MAWAPLAAAGIGAIGSIGGGLLSQSGSQGAAGASGRAGAQALANAQGVAKTDTAQLSPWVQTGAAAANQINALLGLGTLVPDASGQGVTMNQGNWQQNQQDAMAKFQTDPGYLFRQQQGINALDRGGAARGMRLSGAQAKGLNDYGQGMASQEYGNYFNRLAGSSGLGETAANQTNQAYNQAMIPGINDAFQGQMGGIAYGAGGNNALAAGGLGAVNSLASGAMATPWDQLFGGGSGSALAKSSGGVANAYNPFA